MSESLNKSLPLASFDVGDVLKKRLPGISKYLPDFVVNWLRRLICQRELNEILRESHGAVDLEFIRTALRYLNVTIAIEGEENLPPSGRCIFAANHPLGGLDGLIMLQVLGDHYGDGVKFIVNDLLMAVVPCRGMFLPVNKFGSQSQDLAQGLTQALSGDAPVATFPAGLCSRMDHGTDVCDREWKKSFVAKAIEHQRDVVPVYFHARNSQRFYKIARWREKLGIKFNLEMLLLPREMIGSRGSVIRMVIGKPIPSSSLANAPARDKACEIKAIVYALAQGIGASNLNPPSCKQ